MKARYLIISALVSSSPNCEDLHWEIKGSFTGNRTSVAIKTDKLASKSYLIKVLGPEGVQASEHIEGMLLLHDVTPWPAYLNRLPPARIDAVKDSFGWDDEVEFLPYWDNAKFVSLESNVEPVVVSLFKRLGKLLAVVFNNSDSAASVRMTLNLANLRMPSATNAKLVDAYLKPTVKTLKLDSEASRKDSLVWIENAEYPGRLEEVSPVNGTATFTVDKRNFRLFELEMP